MSKLMKNGHIPLNQKEAKAVGEELKFLSEEDLDVAKNMRILREDRGWTQEDLAEKLNIDPEIYASYETGRRYMPSDLLERLGVVFETSES